MPATGEKRRAIWKRYRQRHRPERAAAERRRRARKRKGAPKRQSINLRKCVSLDSHRVERATYANWAAGKQEEFAIGIEDDDYVA